MSEIVEDTKLSDSSFHFAVSATDCNFLGRPLGGERPQKRTPGDQISEIAGCPVSPSKPSRGCDLLFL